MKLDHLNDETIKEILMIQDRLKSWTLNQNQETPFWAT